MKKYNITVNGNTYEVEVDEIGGAPGAIPAAAPAAIPAPAPAPTAAPAAAPAAKPAPATPSAGAAVVESPMPGTIIDVLRKPGDAVADGEVVLILEAMKMENEIVAPREGIVDAVAVVKGASVNAGDIMFSIK
jgi:biotin carboxyl carrier protein